MSVYFQKAWRSSIWSKISSISPMLGSISIMKVLKFEVKVSDQSQIRISLGSKSPQSAEVPKLTQYEVSRNLYGFVIHYLV
ncbi:hypothetical protein FGO68_gene3219 [Halteria grandinella]|uniref:Uncharacterized protein n=1 Tax=Halteria grandinella TaxID=5974 RepID=A0A8J8NXR1_HALGN|nr:hypothetical protein FGO68_gene3219 [Halteria grandinella]